MQHLLTKTFLQGYTSGRRAYVKEWDIFLMLFKPTNLHEELKRYSGPNNWIADLLN